MNKRTKKKSVKKQVQYVWQSIGYLLHLTSLIEYNLINIIAGEKYLSLFDNDEIDLEDILNAKLISNQTLHTLSSKKSMLGKLIYLIEEQGILDQYLIEDLKKVSDLRGYYAHQFFKDDLRKDNLSKNPSCYFHKLRTDIEFIYNIHCEILAIDKEYRRISILAIKNGF